MSRSTKKAPAFGHTKCTSEKEDKRRANKELRRINKVRLENGLEPLDLKEKSDVWCFGKDGKGYISDLDVKKNPDLIEVLKKVKRK